MVKSDNETIYEVIPMGYGDFGDLRRLQVNQYNLKRRRYSSVEMLPVSVKKTLVHR
jgi:hypothetical protein